MKNLFAKIKEQMERRNPCYLVTLVAYEGSVPRNNGAHMLVNADGYVTGTIGGGGMEYSAQLMAQKRLAQGDTQNFVQKFDLSVAAGMACGGYMQVQFCYVAADDANLAFAEQGLQLCSGSGAWWLLVPLGGGRARLRIEKELSLAARTGNVTLDGQSYYAEQYGYDGIVHIFGGGHVARELVPLLAHLGFRCHVYDDRAEFVTDRYFPDAAGLHHVEYAQLDGNVNVRECDYALVMTRGHAHDTNCQRFLLRTPVHYIGVMGSRTKAAMEQGKLRSEGYSEAQLARITTPVGVSIGSETPAEIAVSIAAQLIAVRSGKM